MQTFNHRTPLYALWSEVTKSLLCVNRVPLLFSSKKEAAKTGSNLAGVWYVTSVEVCGPDNDEIDGSIGEEDDQWDGYDKIMRIGVVS